MKYAYVLFVFLITVVSAWPGPFPYFPDCSPHNDADSCTEGCLCAWCGDECKIKNSDASDDCEINDSSWCTTADLLTFSVTIIAFICSCCCIIIIAAGIVKLCIMKCRNGVIEVSPQSWQ